MCQTRVDKEAATVRRSDEPLTTPHVVKALLAAGVVTGGVVVVHSSMSRLGWVVGGAPTIVQALRQAVGADGTIVMPAQTGISDPSTWEAPPVPEAWWPTIREHWPPFDPATTPLRGMGAVVECFSRAPDVVHSGHPSLGFVAVGPLARSLMTPHALAASLGDASPLGRLYEADAQIVLLGIGHGNTTALHLAEHRAAYAAKRTVTTSAPMLIDGERRWVQFDDLEHDDEDFARIGDAYVASGGEQREASLGNSRVTVCRMPPLVDFATSWIAANR